MGDVDILVPPEAVVAASDRLCEAGWSADGQPPEIVRYDVQRRISKNFRKGEFGEIDLHRSVFHFSRHVRENRGYKPSAVRNMDNPVPVYLACADSVRDIHRPVAVTALVYNSMGDADDDTICRARHQNGPTGQARWAGFFP
jgi:hypothetical protein